MDGAAILRLADVVAATGAWLPPALERLEPRASDEAAAGNDVEAAGAADVTAAAAAVPVALDAAVARSRLFFATIDGGGRGSMMSRQSWGVRQLWWKR